MPILRAKKFLNTMANGEIVRVKTTDPGSVKDFQAFAKQTGPTPAVMGFAEESGKETGSPYFNSAAWCVNGEVSEIARKRLLPTYDVFDEARYFDTCNDLLIVEHKGKKVAVTICEDLWNLSTGAAAAGTALKRSRWLCADVG